MIHLLILVFVPFSVFADFKSVDSILFEKPYSLSEKNIDEIVSEVNAKKFTEETFELKVKCNRYVAINKKNRKPVQCEIIGLVKDNFEEEKKSNKR
jgi:hypothetical protein